MPTTLDYGIVVPAAGTEPPDIYGIANRLGASVVLALATYVTPTAWTVVGALGASWVDFATAADHPEYRKEGDVVRLAGLIKDGSTGTTIFTLPAGFRPRKLARFTVVASGGAAFVTVDTAGLVTVVSYIGSGTNAYVDLGGITFSVTA